VTDARAGSNSYSRTTSEHTMNRNIALVAAAVLIVWLSVALVRVENQRYAMAVGMCYDKAKGLPDLVCVHRVETRTAWWWHLFYALTGD